MSVSIDHVGIPAADPRASARFLGEILREGAVTPEGPDGEMVNLSVGHGALTYVGLPAHEPRHVAFRVTGSVLGSAIERLRPTGASGSRAGRDGTPRRGPAGRRGPEAGARGAQAVLQPGRACFRRTAILLDQRRRRGKHCCT